MIAVGWISAHRRRCLLKNGILSRGREFFGNTCCKKRRFWHVMGNICWNRVWDYTNYFIAPKQHWLDVNHSNNFPSFCLPISVRTEAYQLWITRLSHTIYKRNSLLSYFAFFAKRWQDASQSDAGCMYQMACWPRENAYLGQSNLQGLRFTYQEFFTVTLKVLCYKPPAVVFELKINEKTFAFVGQNCEKCRQQVVTPNVFNRT